MDNETAGWSERARKRQIIGNGLFVLLLLLFLAAGVAYFVLNMP